MDTTCKLVSLASLHNGGLTYKMTEKYLVCLDIDGTLVGKDLKISRRNVESLQELIRNDAIVYLVTGRMLYSGQVIARDISSQVKVVGSNGAVIQLDNNYLVRGIMNSIAEELVNLSYDNDFPLFLFGKNKVFYTTTEPEYLHGDSGNRVHSTNLDDYIQLSAQSMDLLDEIANGIIIENNHPEKLKNIRFLLANEMSSKVCLSSSNINNIEILPKNIDKGVAVQELSNFYKIDKSHIVAFGDGENDISMFQKAKYSVAMGNASDNVKSQANYVTDEYYHDGVANFINKYLI